MFIDFLVVSGGKKRGKHAVIMIKKKAHKQSGLLLSKTPKFSDTEKVAGVRESLNNLISFFFPFFHNLLLIFM